jgi:hypothetical protein
VAVDPNGGESLEPNALARLAWQPGSDVPSIYDVQVSVNADITGTRLDRFDADRLPDGYTTFGSEPWRVEAGTIRTGAIEHNQTSSLVLAVELAQAGDLSFRYRLSSELGWDTLEFLVDGRPTLEASGEVAWTEHQVPLTAGQHQLTWRYRRDSTLGGGDNRAWVDDVRVENASLAQWQDVATTPGEAGEASAQWRTPEQASQSAKVRVRSRLGNVASPWKASDRSFVIDEPTSVGLSLFEAGSERSRWVPWAALALAVLLASGIAVQARRARG